MSLFLKCCQTSKEEDRVYYSKEEEEIVQIELKSGTAECLLFTPPFSVTRNIERRDRAIMQIKKMILHNPEVGQCYDRGTFLKLKETFHHHMKVDFKTHLGDLQRKLLFIIKIENFQKR